MVASTDIKFYVHTNTNAPQLTNNYGCMIAVLDACLVNGFGSQTVSTLTASGTTVTATFGSAHNFMQYQVIKITGATQTEFNGEHRILSIPDTSSFTFELAAVPSVTTATGTISASLPPLGWEKPFSSTNEAGGGKAAYRSTNLLLPSRPFLRVVDELDPAYTGTYAKYAKVGIVEDMTDIDTMLGVQAPYDSAAPDKNWVGSGSGTSAYNGWAKWYYATANPISDSSDTSVPSTENRDYIVVGTRDFFYILPSSNNLARFNFSYGFGSFQSLLNVDTANIFLSASFNYTAASTAQYRGTYGGLNTNQAASNRVLLFKPYNMASNYTRAKPFSLAFSSSSAAMSSGSSDLIAAQTLTNTVPLFPVFLIEDTSLVIRSKLNHIFWLCQKIPYTHKQIFTHNSECFIAVNALHTNEAGSGQIVLKIGGI